MGTIAAIATARGQGGIAIIRMSGPDALAILRLVFQSASPAFKDFSPWRLHHGTVVDSCGEALDEALVVHMPAPNTYTGEEMAEIHCHGGQFVVEKILETLLQLGARQAERGEFTRRAFLNGKMDLSQAEAVAELIAAPSREALRYGYRRLEGLFGRRVAGLRQKLDELRALSAMGVDFPDDEVPVIENSEFQERLGGIRRGIGELLKCARRAKTMQNGARVVLAGAVNAGKSSLFNALCGRNRALVTSMEGTTRDFLEEFLSFEDLPICLVDTAGLRNNEATETSIDPVERLGMERSRDLLDGADVIALVLDGEKADPRGAPAGLCSEILARAGNRSVILVWNKCDRKKPDIFPPDWAKDRPGCVVSAATGENLETFTRLVREEVLRDSGSVFEGGLAPNERQAMSLMAADGELAALEAELPEDPPYDLRLAHLDTAADALKDILGISSQAELLDQIFSKFCIGK